MATRKRTAGGHAGEKAGEKSDGDGAPAAVRTGRRGKGAGAPDAEALSSGAGPKGKAKGARAAATGTARRQAKAARNRAARPAASGATGQATDRATDRAADRAADGAADGDTGGLAAAGGTPAPADPVELFETWTALAGRAQQKLMEHWAALPDSATPGLPDPGAQAASLAELWSDWARAWTGADAGRLAAVAGDYWTEAMQLWGAILSGRPDALPDAAARHDRRFADDKGWGTSPVFDLVRRSYLLASHHMLRALDALDVPDPEAKARLAFQTRQVVDAMSPANFAALNPEVLAHAQATGGESLVRGLENLLDDLGRGKLSMTDETAFEVGRNVAATPGAVVFENRLFQLIHYRPTTPEVFETPLLIVPPWINKYYILDLTPEKSFIAWAVAQGLSVFVLSWRQGGAATADAGIDAYAIEGIETALDNVLAITGAQAAHMIGYCVAGTILAAQLARMAALGTAGRVRTVTFLTAQVDFTDAGDLKAFTTEAGIEAVESLARANGGVVDGRWLATSFNMLRPTDLLWSYVVNNYLKGREPPPFDLLYWNSDPTSVPGRFMSEYLRGLYRDNRLSRPGGIAIAGTPIDLKQVRTPAYVQAGRDDHIAPAASCFRLTKLLGGSPRFMLAGSGHIAGVVNPPAAGKYQYWTLPEGVPTPETLDAFREAATETRGSWWPDWIGWITPRSGARVAARQPGAASGFPAIEPAPGRYVKERIA